MLNLELPSFPISFALCFLISPEWNLLSFHPKTQHCPHQHRTWQSPNSTHCSPEVYPVRRSGRAGGGLPVSPWVVFPVFQVSPSNASFLCFLSFLYPQILSFWGPLSLFCCSENLPSTFAHLRTDFWLAFVTWFLLGLYPWLMDGTRKALSSPPSNTDCLQGLHLFWILILLSPTGSISASWTVSLLFFYFILIRH